MRFDKAKLAAYYRDAPDDISLDTLDLSRIPAHVSLIMDGNGRWAKAQGLERTKGHRAGVTSLREAVTTAVRLGLDVLSVYAFSTENWRRSQKEVNFLMQLFAETLIKELPLFHQENVRLRFFGNLEALPKKTYMTFQRGLTETKDNTGMIFALAVNYGARAELTRAAALLAKQAQEGSIDPEAILICLSELREKSVFPTIFFGRLPIQSSTLHRYCGPTLLAGIFCVRLWRIKSVKDALGVRSHDGREKTT